MIKTFVYLILLVSVMGMGCTKKREVATIRIADRQKKLKNNWNALVKDSTKVNLTDSGLNKELSSITQIVFLKNGEMVIPDGYSNTLFILKEDGALRKKINKSGKGPGEFNSISRITVDQHDNIYLFDPFQKKMIAYQAPDYEHFKEYFIKNYISRFAVISGPEEVATYSPYTKYLFNEINLKNSNKIGSAILPKNADYKIWMARIQSGGIAFNAKEKVLYGLYPDQLAIYKFTASLNLQAKIIPKSEKQFYKPFPENLDPYGQDLRHEKWWASFNHLGRIKLLDDDKIIVTYYGKSSKDDLETNVFLNIYDLKRNKIIAENIELPAKANLAGVRGNNLYISYAAHLDAHDKEVYFQLYKYKLKI